MPQTVETFAVDILQPKQFPEDARTLAGRFGNSLTLAKGTVLALSASDEKLYAYTDSGDYAAAVGILQYSIVTDASGNVYFGTSSVASPSNPQHASAPIYVAGTFDPGDLTGWDANAAADLHAKTLPNGFVRIP